MTRGYYGLEGCPIHMHSTYNISIVLHGFLVKESRFNGKPVIIFIYSGSITSCKVQYLAWFNYPVK